MKILGAPSEFPLSPVIVISIAALVAEIFSTNEVWLHILT